jgi:hypothetical protein
MKIMRYVLMVSVCLLLSGMTATAGEPLPLAEEGSAEAEALKEAHQADLEGAMESPEEAERRTQWLHEKEGTPTVEVKSAPEPAPETEPKPEPETEPEP